MLETKVDPTTTDPNPQETTEWLEALDGIVDEAGPERASWLLHRLTERAAEHGISAPQSLNTPYINTIPVDEEVPYPGDRDIELEHGKGLLAWVL